MSTLYMWSYILLAQSEFIKLSTMCNVSFIMFTFFTPKLTPIYVSLIHDAADWESKWLKTPFRAPYFINYHIDISVLVAGVLSRACVPSLILRLSWYTL